VGATIVSENSYIINFVMMSFTINNIRDGIPWFEAFAGLAFVLGVCAP
jgi:hypothetical protein